MQIPALDEATLASVRAKHAHRFPQTATLRPPADRGAGALEIPIVIGNPSGACKMPTGTITRAVWSEYVRPALTGAAQPASLALDIALDCVLWPDNEIVLEIFNEWAALPQIVAGLVNDKIGRSITADPKIGEKPPAEVANHLAGRPRAVWRWVRPARGDAFALVVEPPNLDAYTTFSDILAARVGEHWKASRELVAACVSLAVQAGAPASLDAIVDRFPGVALSLAREASALGGIVAAAELGE